MHHRNHEDQMTNVKIAVIGAGSFVFGPSVLSQALLEQRLDGVELALVDIDLDALQGMAGIGRRMAREAGVRATTLDASRTESRALEGADFVICAAARQLYHRFEIDCAIVDRYLPGHLVTEFGGIAGISYSLRQIALIVEIAADMRRLCPEAWLLFSSNPLPRVCQAAHELGVCTAGFCSVSLEGYSMLWRIWHGEGLGFPVRVRAAAMERNHGRAQSFCWVTELTERSSGADLLPELRQRLYDGASSGHPRSDHLCHATGYLLVPNDAHTQDFLPPAGTSHTRSAPGHGSPDDRQQRLMLLDDIATGQAPLDQVLQHPSWERPVDLIAAMAFNKPIYLPLAESRQSGQIPSLPRGVFVETPATCSREGPVPATVTLPAEVLPLCAQTARVSDTIVRAALQHDRRLVHEAVVLDPTILDKQAGIRGNRRVFGSTYRCASNLPAALLTQRMNNDARTYGSHSRRNGERLISGASRLLQLEASCLTAVMVSACPCAPRRCWELSR
jgi:alpha-galactosidase